MKIELSIKVYHKGTYGFEPVAEASRTLTVDPDAGRKALAREVDEALMAVDRRLREIARQERDDAEQ